MRMRGKGEGLIYLLINNLCSLYKVLMPLPTEIVKVRGWKGMGGCDLFDLVYDRSNFD